MDAQQKCKRKAGFDNMSARKAPKLTDPKPAGKMTFAQKMMAKMGHVEGQGLGKGGEGIINPIEVKLRPQGVGVGAVKEKTEQYKQEQRRAAEARGEEYEDSSEEERKARRRRKEKARATDGSRSGGAVGAAGVQRKKTKYRTVEEVQAAAPGLELPKAMLGSIVDATGNEPKLLTSTAGLMGTGMVKAESEEDKIKKRERIELEAFIEAWHGLQERKLHLEQHEGQLQLEISQMRDDFAKVRDVLESLSMLTLREDMAAASASPAADWKSAIMRLESLQERHPYEIESFGLSDAAVSVLTVPFQEVVEDWDPLEEPDLMADDLLKLRTILGISKHDEVTMNGGIDPELRKYRKRKTTTPFETLIYKVWLPKVSTAAYSWSCRDPQAMIAVVEAWQPILPPFVFSNVMEQLVVPKLTEGLRTWNPKKMKHSKSISEAMLPHVWIFPWLPFLPAHHLDPRSPTSLISEVRRSLRLTLSTWDIASGTLPGLDRWSSLMGTEISDVLVKYLLPRLAAYLTTNFEVDPSDQKLNALDAVLNWRSFFSPKIYARLMVAEFFPKLLAILHQWLSSPDADISETTPWLDWWKSVIPAEINGTKDVQSGWTDAQRMIDSAVDILVEGGDISKLTPPAAGPARPIAKDENVKKLRDESRTETGARSVITESTYKDVVEAWCAEQDLTMLPLREAHAGTGAPLFRISASATGRGGVVVYLWNDTVMAQKKGDKEVFQPYQLDDELMMRAEGK